MYDIDSIATRQHQSATATVCENAQLFGAASEHDEFDPRNGHDTLDAVGETFRIMAEGVTPDGFQLADERENMLCRFVDMLDAQVWRLDRSVGRLAPEIRDLQRAQIGTEITVDAITVEHVRVWFASMADRPGATNRSLPVLSVIMRMAELWGYRPHNSNP